MMVGRTIYEATPELPERPSEEIVLEVRNINRGKVLQDINFYLKKGEILGFAGLMGAGRTEVARAIFGADPIDSGEIYVNGQKVQVTSPQQAVWNGIGYLSEDRKRYGLALGLELKENIAMASLGKFLGFLGWVNSSQIRSTAKHHIDDLEIKTPSAEQRVKNLSGGNQQKVVIGKWLTADTEILIFDEPTRGVDVGAKSEIYKLLNELARAGKSIIMISSELPEILRMSHRVIVMCEGKITGELPIAEATQEKIMTLATARKAIVNDTIAAPSAAA
jgi:ribose transport system ATP-binding protein